MGIFVTVVMVRTGVFVTTLTLTFCLESGIRVTCDVGCLCANFGLAKPLYSRLRPDVRDRPTDRQTDRRQTDVRQTSVKSIA